MFWEGFKHVESIRNDSRRVEWVEWGYDGLKRIERIEWVEWGYEGSKLIERIEWVEWVETRRMGLRGFALEL